MLEIESRSFKVPGFLGSATQAVAGFTAGDALPEAARSFFHRLVLDPGHTISNGRGLPQGIMEDAMKNLALKVQRFLTSEDGPTAVEYAVMLALIVIVCLAAITSIGTNANTTFQGVATAIGS